MQKPGKKACKKQQKAFLGCNKSKIILCTYTYRPMSSTAVVKPVKNLSCFTQ
jgi:hypothetical protein